MDEKHDASRCKQCDHLVSFHGEDGCGTWLLGVRAVPLYRCACVVSSTKTPVKFPILSSPKFEITPVVASETTTPAANQNEAKVAKLIPASQLSANAQANLRHRLNDVAEGLRRTAAELKNLEDTLDNTLRRLSPGKNTSTPHISNIHQPTPESASAEHFRERRNSNDRRRRHYAMIAERRVNDRRTVSA